jgi:hypothetical protein
MGMANDAPKSAYELALERLKKKDAEEGIEHRPLTDEQKAAIAEVRNFYESKLAELDVLHQGQMRRIADPADRETREQDYRRDRERLATERDAKIERVRRSS